MRTMACLPVLVAASLACLGPPSRVRGPAPEFLRSQAERRVWATLVDGTSVVLERPRVIADTMIGVSRGSLLVVPVDHVAEVRVKRISAVRTGLLAAGAGTAAVLLFTLGRSSAGTPEDTSDFYACRSQPNPTLCS